MIVPYVQVNGAWTFPDDFVVRQFERCKRDGIVEAVFLVGKVDSGEALLKVFKSPKNVVHFGFLENENEPCSIAWLNNFGPRHAYAHYLVFREFWKQNLSVRIMKESIGYWFGMKHPETGVGLFDTLVGNTPCRNRAATLFLRKMGMEIMGEIPNTGLVISYLTRERWEHGLYR